MFIFSNKRLIGINFINEIGKHIIVIIKRKGKVRILGKLNMRHNVIINVNGGLLQLGDNVFINSFSSINSQKNIIIGNEVLIGEGVRIYDHDHDYKSYGVKRKNSFSASDVIIGNGVWICSNAVILKGTVIGDNAVIAAGAIVKGNVPAGVIYISKNKHKKIFTH